MPYRVGRRENLALTSGVRDENSLVLALQTEGSDAGRAGVLGDQWWNQVGGALGQESPALRSPTNFLRTSIPS